MITFTKGSTVVQIFSNLVYPSNNKPVLPMAIARTQSGIPIVEKYLSYEKDIITLKWKKMSTNEYNILLNFFRNTCNWAGSTVTYTDLDDNNWQVIITRFEFERNSPGYYEGEITLETVV
jgi:hypothetical protein